MIGRFALPGSAALLAFGVAMSPNFAVEVKNETYTLPNGLTVILHEDHRLPQVVVNVLYAVGAKDETKGRTGFAHLFEHLMFMGTARVPSGQFDALMEAGGGANNASTSNDLTTYFSNGPGALLPLLVWLDADRMEALGANMTQDKVNLQRDVVRNERRQSVENTPYGVAELIIPEALYPPGHPYHHPVIGSHEDLEAATVQDVKDFFATFYVPANASLVVAGHFDPARIKPLIASTFGAVRAKPAPSPVVAAPPALEREVRRLAVDKVEFPRLYVVWPAPAAYAPGAAEMELTARILGGSPSSRLEKRLVQETRLAQSVDVFVDSRALGGEFHIEVTAAPGADLEQIKRETLAVVDGLKREGPAESELTRVKAQTEAAFLKGMESLLERALRLNFYRYYFGAADSFDRDLARQQAVTAAGVKTWSQQVFGEGRLDLRVIPGTAAAENNTLDQRPADLPAGSFAPPAPQVFKLANGVQVQVVPQPRTGLFAGWLVADGGERIVPADKAGLAPLAAALLTSGAAGKSASQFAEAVESQGAAINALASSDDVRVMVSGLSSRMDATLDLFADALLRPNLAEDDFQRESGLALARIRARADNPAVVAGLAARRAIFGAGDHHGRPVEGFENTVGRLKLADVKEMWPRFLDPGRASLVFVGDFEVEALRRALDARLGGWRPSAAPRPPASAPLARTSGGRVILIDRVGAPQTVIYAARPAPPVDEQDRASRECINTLFGGSFTSRLNQNLREKHGYTYGIRTGFLQDGAQHLFFARTSVQTAVTGAALSEMKREFAALAGGDVTPAEFTKAVRTERQGLVERVQTTNSLAATFADLLADGRSPEALREQLSVMERLDPPALNALARSGLFDWSSLVVVLVGDKKEVLPQLQKEGFPTPILANPEGEPL